MVSDLVDNDSNVRVNRKMELVTVPENSGGNAMIGICYLVKEDADIVAKRIDELCKSQHYDGAFWEEALYNKDRMIVAARVVHSADVVEINTYEQLREIDSDSNQLKTDAIQVICEALDARPEAVTDITVLKKGMTNRSFMLPAKGRNISCEFRAKELISLSIVVRKQRFIRLLMGSIFAMILLILIRKMAIKSRNSWKAREYVIL